MFVEERRSTDFPTSRTVSYSFLRRGRATASVFEPYPQEIGTGLQHLLGGIRKMLLLQASRSITLECLHGRDQPARLISRLQIPYSPTLKGSSSGFVTKLNSGGKACLLNTILEEE